MFTLARSLPLGCRFPRALLFYAHSFLFHRLFFSHSSLPLSVWCFPFLFSLFNLSAWRGGGGSFIKASFKSKALKGAAHRRCCAEPLKRRHVVGFYAQRIAQRLSPSPPSRTCDEGLVSRKQCLRLRDKRSSFLLCRSWRASSSPLNPETWPAPAPRNSELGQSSNGFPLLSSCNVRTPFLTQRSSTGPFQCRAESLATTCTRGALRRT